MIDPVIFSFKLFVWTITLRWYGVLVMFGAVVGAWIAEKEIRRRGENGEVNLGCHGLGFASGNYWRAFVVCGK